MISFANNQIYDFSNGGDNPVNISDRFGKGGVVDLSNNAIKRIPNPLGLKVDITCTVKHTLIVSILLYTTIQYFAIVSWKNFLRTLDMWSIVLN